MQIRSAIIADAEVIAALASQLGYPAASAEVARLHAVLLQHGDHAVFVAEEQDGSVSGWVHVFLSRRLFMPAFAELGGIVVEETRRGPGFRLP
jgi:hypothetical protein